MATKKVVEKKVRRGTAEWLNSVSPDELRKFAREQSPRIDLSGIENAGEMAGKIKKVLAKRRSAAVKDRLAKRKPDAEAKEALAEIKAGLVEIKPIPPETVNFEPLAEQPDVEVEIKPIPPETVNFEPIEVEQPKYVTEGQMASLASVLGGSISALRDQANGQTEELLKQVEQLKNALAESAKAAATETYVDDQVAALRKETGERIESAIVGNERNQFLKNLRDKAANWLKERPEQERKK